MRPSILLALALATALTASCVGDHPQSPLNAVADRAADIVGLWRVMLALLGSAYVLVLVLGGMALLRRRRDEREPRAVSTPLWLGGGGLALPLVVLTTLLVLTLATLRAEAAADDGEADLTIKVVAKQWWWRVEYEHAEPQSRVRTANEIHVPVGRTIRMELESRDVIHSFWIPALDGKVDMFPGRTTYLTFRVGRPGVYRGQCAEYCGMQHANMAFVVVAHDSAAFEEWYRHELTEARPPRTALEAEGRRVFLEKPCALCHEVRGTDAHATVGPDLTHLASRRTLAAGTLPNQRGALGGWISNPQTLKPGAHMPDIDLSADELHALLAFLESLR